MKEPFSTFQRKIKKIDGEKTVFYVKYRNPKTGAYMTPISLDKFNELLGAKSGKRITSKAKAIRIAQLALDRKLCEQTKVKKATDKGKAQKAGPKPKPITARLAGTSARATTSAGRTRRSRFISHMLLLFMDEQAVRMVCGIGC